MKSALRGLNKGHGCPEGREVTFGKGTVFKGIGDYNGLNNAPSRRYVYLVTPETIDCGLT